MRRPSCEVPVQFRNLFLALKSIKRLRTSPQKYNKCQAIASFLLKVTNTQMETEDFQVLWHPGLLQDHSKTYQTDADVTKKVE